MKVSWILCVFLAGCGLTPQKVSLSDPKIQRLFDAARKFPREQYGFTSLPTDPKTDIRIENHEKGAYHVMLHIYGPTSRTIAFLQTESGYQWIHEQEGFKGPKFYESPDGHLQEILYLTFEIISVSTSQTNTLQINYYGDDSRLSSNHDLKLGDVEPILIEWGYKKQAIEIGTPLAERPSHTTNRTDRVTCGSATY